MYDEGTLKVFLSREWTSSSVIFFDTTGHGILTWADLTDIVFQMESFLDIYKDTGVLSTPSQEKFCQGKQSNRKVWNNCFYINGVSTKTSLTTQSRPLWSKSAPALYAIAPTEAAPVVSPTPSQLSLIKLANAFLCKVWCDLALSIPTTGARRIQTSSINPISDYAEI